MSVESPLTTNEAEGSVVTPSLPAEEVQLNAAIATETHVAEPSVDENATDKNRRKPIAHPIPTRLRDRFPHGMNWVNFTWMLTMHSGAVAALFYFSWTGLAICAVLHFVTACLGVTLGYHRLLTHGSFKVSKPVEYFLSCCGMLSAEGSPIFWVATHRKHHVLSDLPGDPHSPNDGFWWSHILWFKPRTLKSEEEALFARWAPDLWKDPWHRVFDRIFPVFTILLGIGLFIVGEAAMGPGMGWSLALWGVCMRAILCYHSTWFVNSATHVWGYRNYETTDRSRNLWWVALVSYGEGWHNNHHAHQRLARHGHRKWEIDVTWMVIRTMQILGLATNVQDRIPEQTK